MCVPLLSESSGTAAGRRLQRLGSVRAVSRRRRRRRRRRSSLRRSGAAPRVARSKRGQGAHRRRAAAARAPVHARRRRVCPRCACAVRRAPRRRDLARAAGAAGPPWTRRQVAKQDRACVKQVAHRVAAALLRRSVHQVVSCPVPRLGPQPPACVTPHAPSARPGPYIWDITPLTYLTYLRYLTYVYICFAV